MKKNFRTFFLLFSVLLVSMAASAQKKAVERGYNAITIEQSRNYVEFLADDLLQGRDAGEPGGYIASRYIVSLLREWGVQPFLEGDYYQPFEAAQIVTPVRNSWEIDPDSIARIKEVGFFKTRSMNNILAMIPGELSDEYVIIGAHYDHLGLQGDVDVDGLYNGADDNASGVSAVLQIAKAIKAVGERPKRTVIFAFWDGEEKGLLGSKFFVKNWENHSRIKAYMNFDMVGRGPVDNPRYLKYFFTEAHPVFGEWLREDCKERGFSFEPDYVAWDRPVGGSDNGPFARVDVPIVWYHTEGHPDYHRPSDSAEKIDYPKLLDITRAAYLCAWRMANEKEY